MAEYYMEQDMMRMGVLDRPKRKQKRITWTSSDGRVWEPHEMEDLHLLNTIHLCERREGDKGIHFLNDALTYKALVNELIKRGKLKYAYYDLSLEERLAYRF